MAVPTRPARAARAGARAEKTIRRPWWHYALLVSGLLTLALMARGGYAIWFAVSHVRASYARVTGLVVNVAAKSDSRVQTVPVRTGEEVEKGQIVAILDKADLEAEVERCKATLAAKESDLARSERELDLTIREAAASVEEAEAQLAAAEARLRQSEAEHKMQAKQQPDEVRQASADLDAAKSRLREAVARLKRMEKLRAQGAVSDENLDAARTAQQTAEATVEAAEAGLAVAQTQDYRSQIRQHSVATRRAEESQAKAGLKSAETQTRRVALAEEQVLAQRAAVAETQATLDAARVRLSDAVLRSPVNGIVVRGPGRSVRDGEVVETGFPIVTVLSTDVPFWISASISEIYATRVKEGQPVLIRIDALSRWIFGKKWLHGKIDKVGAATEFQATEGANPWMTQQVPIRIDFDPAGESIKAGATCRVWIDIQE